MQLCFQQGDEAKRQDDAKGIKIQGIKQYSKRLDNVSAFWEKYLAS